jgi:two-component system, NarL family, sensor histidine kinase UhpB
MMTRHPEAAGVRSRPVAEQGLGVRLLRVRLFWKILLANALLMALMATAVAWAAPALAAAGPDAQWPGLALVAAVGVALTLAVNALILRVALRPLDQLQETAERVSRGDLTARVADSPVADPQMARLMRTFNTMLDSTAEYRKRLRDLAVRALGAGEEERKRIARELHDGTAQTLAALRVQLRVARRAGDERTREVLLDELSEQLGALVDEIREMAGGLRPSSLDMLGLGPALESYVRSLTERTGLHIDARLDPVAGMLPPEAELALYRVLQEALSNVVRHSDAEHVSLRLFRRNGRVEALVADDGRGFAVEEAHARGALGLWGMQERAAYVGGSVEVASTAGKGTRVEIRIPVAERAPDVGYDSNSAG